MFAWSPKDMPGVPTDFAEHKLHVRSYAKPVKKHLRHLSEEKRRIVGEEITRLLAAGFFMELFFQEWLANPVLVLKKNNKWRMCIGYTSLNKACHKDPFALRAPARAAAPFEASKRPSATSSQSMVWLVVHGSVHPARGQLAPKPRHAINGGASNVPAAGPPGRREVVR